MISAARGAAVKPAAVSSQQSTAFPGASSAVRQSSAPASSVFRSIGTNSDDDSQSSSIQIGKGGSKFMRKRPSVVEEVPEVKDQPKKSETPATKCKNVIFVLILISRIAKDITFRT